MSSTDNVESESGGDWWARLNEGETEGSSSTCTEDEEQGQGQRESHARIVGGATRKRKRRYE